MDCLLNGLMLDSLYEEVIQEIECKETKLSMETAIIFITAHAVHHHADQLLPTLTTTVNNVETKTNHKGGQFPPMTTSTKLASQYVIIIS
jgi:hypothetical protein